jgi:hypothetical protein
MFEDKHKFKNSVREARWITISIVCKPDHILHFFYVPHKTETLEGVWSISSNQNTTSTIKTHKFNPGFQKCFHSSVHDRVQKRRTHQNRNESLLQKQKAVKQSTLSTLASVYRIIFRRCSGQRDSAAPAHTSAEPNTTQFSPRSN